MLEAGRLVSWGRKTLLFSAGMPVRHRVAVRNGMDVAKPVLDEVAFGTGLGAQG